MSDRASSSGNYLADEATERERRGKVPERGGPRSGQEVLNNYLALHRAPYPNTYRPDGKPVPNTLLAIIESAKLLQKTNKDKFPKTSDGWKLAISAASAAYRQEYGVPQKVRKHPIPESKKALYRKYIKELREVKWKYKTAGLGNIIPLEHRPRIRPRDVEYRDPALMSYNEHGRFVHRGTPNDFFATPVQTEGDFLLDTEKARIGERAIKNRTKYEREHLNY